MHTTTDHRAAEPTSGAALLPLFAIATVIAIVAICVVVAAPSTAAMIFALVTVIGFAAGIAALLGRLIGPEEH
jgi:putative Mn2+ efflux pump MntP